MEWIFSFPFWFCFLVVFLLVFNCKLNGQVYDMNCVFTVWLSISLHSESLQWAMVALPFLLICPCHVVCVKLRVTWCSRWCVRLKKHIYVKIIKIIIIFILITPRHFMNFCNPDIFQLDVVSISIVQKQMTVFRIHVTNT